MIISFHFISFYFVCMIHVGTLGRPGPAPLASRPSPRALKGKSSEARRPRNARSTLCQGNPRGLGPDASQTRNAQLILRPGARESLRPDAMFSLSAYFPNPQLHPEKLPAGSPLYKHEFIHELTPSPLTK